MVQFEEYCNNTPGLYFLQNTHSVAATRKKLVNKQPIISLQPGESIYVDVRTWGEQWYESIGSCSRPVMWISGKSQGEKRSHSVCMEGVHSMENIISSTTLVCSTGAAGKK